jgi:hypothetical protein
MKPEWEEDREQEGCSSCERRRDTPPTQQRIRAGQHTHGDDSGKSDADAAGETPIARRRLAKAAPLKEYSG